MVTLRFGARKLGFGRDYCESCRQVRMCVLSKSFHVHLAKGMIPIPTGMQVDWRCEECGHDPHPRAFSSSRTIVVLLGALLFIVFLLFVMVIPRGGPVGNEVWISLTVIVLLSLAILAGVRYRQRHQSLIAAIVEGIQPLEIETCYFCGGALTGTGVRRCGTCGARAYEPSDIASDLRRRI